MNEKKKLLSSAKLPEKIKVELIDAKKLKQLEREEQKEEFDLIKQLLVFLNTFSFTFADPGKNYKFGLPSCYFDFENHDEILQIDVPVFDEQIPRQNLNEEMLSQIEKDGTFKVESKKFEMNYQWKISSLLIKGKEVILDQFWQILGLAHQFLIRTQRLFSFGKAVYVMSEGRKYSLNLWSALAQIPAFFLNLFNLIFGVPSFKNYTNVKRACQDTILEERTQSLKEEDFPEIFYLAKNLQTFQKYKHSDDQRKYSKQISDNRQKIQEFHQNMEELWLAYFNEQKDLLEDCEEEEFIEKSNRILSQKENFILENFDECASELNVEMKKCLKNFYKVVQIIKHLKWDQQKRLTKLQEKTIEAIKKQNPYMSKVYFWFKHEKKVQFKNIRKQVQEEFTNNLTQRLEKENLKEYLKFYKMTKDLQNKNNNKEYKIKIAQKLQSATTFTIDNHKYPPYEVVKYGERSYGFKYVEKVEVSSDHFFWRVTLFLKRWFYYSKHCTITSFRYMLRGELGIKGLLSTKAYFYKYSINYQTGEVKKNARKMTPIIAKFRTTIQGIKKSRDNFENTPDNAIFGKNFQRVFNYIECYFFRFFIVAILLVSILHPLLNLFVITYLFLQGVLSFVYVFVLLSVQQLFRIIFYNFEPARVTHNLKLDYRKHYYEILLENFKAFPLIHLILALVFLGFFQLGHILFLSYLYPVLSLIISAYGFVAYYLRLFYDRASFRFIIKPLAKVPSRDTNLARKIAGPGVSRNLYYTLKIEDSIQLVMAHLEKMKLEHYKKLINDYLFEDYNNLKNKKNTIFKNYLSSANYENHYQRATITKYLQILDDEINDRIQKLLFLKKNLFLCSIKFTESDLKDLKESTFQILQNNLKEYLVNDFVWGHYQVKEGHFKRLTCKVLNDVFQGNEISMESLQDTEKRIVLRQTEESYAHINRKQRMIKNAIKGNVLLDNYQPQFFNRQQNQQFYIGKTTIQKILNQLQSPSEIFREVFIRYEIYNKKKIEQISLIQFIIGKFNYHYILKVGIILKLTCEANRLKQFSALVQVKFFLCFSRLRYQTLED